MHTFTSSETASQPYVSRRKRYRRQSEPQSKLKTRTLLGLLGLLATALLVSLVIIATQIGANDGSFGQQAANELPVA